MDSTRQAAPSVWRAGLFEAGWLVALAVVLAAGWWARNPNRLPLAADPAQYELELEAPLVSVADALLAFDEGMQLFVDTRAGDFSSTIPGSFFISEATFDDDLSAIFDFVVPEDHFILFGDGNLNRVSNIAGRLKMRGYENVKILKGGLSAWQHDGGTITNHGREEKS